MKYKLKNFAVLAGTIAALTTPVVAVVSCGKKKTAPKQTPEKQAPQPANGGENTNTGQTQPPAGPVVQHPVNTPEQQQTNPLSIGNGNGDFSVGNSI